MRALALTLTLVATVAVAEEPKLPELNMNYSVSWNGISLGQALITLKPEGGADCYRYESATDPVGIVRMFYGKPHETSYFCVQGGKVVPKKFIYTRTDDDSFTLEFDMAAKKVRDGAGKERDIPADAQDRFGMHQAVRLWLLARLKEKDPGAEKLELAQVDDRRVRNYTLAITGRETVRIPAGTFDCVVVPRIDDPKKTVKFWIAPEKDYMPVKFEQVGPNTVRMVLRKG